MNLKAGYPFSLIRYGIPYNYPRLTTHEHTDVLIVGGGITGALMAYHLNKAGIDCILVDRRTIGMGSTCASTSLLQYEIDIPLYKLAEMIGEKPAVRAYKLCLDAIYSLADIAYKIKFNHFEFNQSLLFAARKKDEPGLCREFELRKKHGFRVDYLNPRKIMSRFRFDAPGAILSYDGAYTDAYMFTHALLQQSINNGLKVYDRTPVSGPVHEQKGMVFHTDEGLRITAKKVVYTTGYEATEMIGKKIVNLHSTYAVTSETIPHCNELLDKDIMLWNTADPYLYIRQTQDQRIIVGGRDVDFYTAPKRDKLIARKSRQLVQDFTRLFPHIPFKPEFSWTGTFGTTRDGLPYIGAYKRIPGTYFALGFGGNGIIFSLIAAQIATDHFKGRANVDAVLFSFDR